MEDADRARGVYGITTAAELAGLAVPTLRLYERRGLIEPQRTDGGTRRYSDDDLSLLGRIDALVADGVNLAGVAHVLALETTNHALTSRNDELETENAHLRGERETTVTEHDSTTRDDVPEADRLDQLAATDPAETPDAAPATDRWDADPADVAAQHAVVTLDEDAHPGGSDEDDRA